MHARELASSLLKHELNTKTALTELSDAINEHSDRMDSFEASTIDNFKRQELQREEHNKKMEAKMNQLSEWFDSHNMNEMEKYDMIITELKKLSESYAIVKIGTDDNTSLLKQKSIEEEKDRAVKEALEQADKPYRDIRQHAIIAAVTVITGAVVVGIWKLIMFVGDIDNLVKGAM